jgi:membrane protease YdiL (CAAX protease family)
VGIARGAELLVLYVLLPATIVSGLVPLAARWLVFLVTGLWVCVAMIRGQIGLQGLGLKPVRPSLARLLAVLVVGAAVVIGLIHYVDVVPTSSAVRWGLVFVLYPAISVPAQEIFFRGFFFARYGNLLPACALIAANAVLFGLYHAIFGSGLAVAAAMAAGALLAALYSRTRNLYLSWVLHYGFGVAAYAIGWADGFTALPMFAS